MHNTVSMARRVTFSSGHRYWKEGHSEEENQRIFGPWASPYNHGHNYVLWAKVSGTIDPETGMVINIKRIDALLRQAIVSEFDQKSLNDQVPEFSTRPASLENLLHVISDRLRVLPDEVELTQIRLEETERLYAELDLTQIPAMTTLTRTYEFAAAHRLNAPMMSQAQNVALYGKCNNPEGHGHNYVLEVTVRGDINPEDGMIVSIADLDAIVNHEVVDRYDHKNLNRDIPEFDGQITTSEVVAQMIWTRLKDAVPAKLYRIRLFETARNVFEVTE